MASILQILKEPLWDSSVSKKEDVIINPNNPNALQNNDVVYFGMNQSDVLIHPAEAYVEISGEIKKTGGVGIISTAVANGGALHLFSRAELRVNSQTVEEVIEPGLTCIPKIYTTFTEGEARHLQIMGWDATADITEGGKFHAIIPFKVLFGFAEDFDTVLVNTRLELLLTRSRSDDNALHSFGATAEAGVSIVVTKIQLKLPFVQVDDANRLEMLKVIEKDHPLKIAFRTWELYQYPTLPQTKKHSWSIKTSTQLEKPRYVILFFQTGRDGVITKTSSEFDHCDLQNVKVVLNNEAFPSPDNLDQDFEGKNYLRLYNMYCNFSKDYKKHPNYYPLLTYSTFKTKATLIPIDCCNQKEAVKHGAVDVRIDFELKKAAPANTVCNVIIVHDTVFEYRPLTNSIRKYEN